MNETRQFTEVLKRHDRELRMLAYRLLRDRVAMDDAMQDAYLKAYRGLPAFRGDAEAKTWLYRIVYNTCLDRLRSVGRSREVSLEALAETVPDDAAGVWAWPRNAGRAAVAAGGTTADPADVVARREDLSAALARLAPDQRAVVLLVDAMGFSYEEAAEVVGARPGTVGSRLNHARSVLRTTLAEGSDHDR